MTPQERAERSAAAMWASDDASKWVGMSLQRVTPGGAVLALRVEKHHTNGHDICHGGVIFTLADSAFAFACNSYNQVAVAQHNMISFTEPGHLGDDLTATAREVSLRGKSGLYDVRVARGDGTVIAEMRGCSRIIAGQHFEEET
ncbi:MAG: hydroxyphenylacetyl-CoA thioesterase PaaI [Rhodobacter sp.]|nr:hydroxyphenylacetyl-CoA thioesterase PaaI [Rhodobacter sp.]